MGEAGLARLSRGWAWEVEEEDLHRRVAAAAEVVVAEPEVLQLGVVERVRLRELVVVAEGMGELVVAELRLRAPMGELAVEAVCWIQATEEGVGDHCLSMAAVVLAERRMAGEAAATLVRCWVSWGVMEAAKLHSAA